jgi:hypothetical protein
VTTQILNLPLVDVSFSTSADADWRNSFIVTVPDGAGVQQPIDLRSIVFTMRIRRSEGSKELLMQLSTTKGDLIIGGAGYNQMAILVPNDRMGALPIGNWPMDILAIADGAIVEFATGTVNHGYIGGSKIETITTVPRVPGAAVAAYAVPAGPAGPVGPTGSTPWGNVAAWVSANNYSATAPASVATYNGECYVCIVTHTSTASFDPSKWTKIAASGVPAWGPVAAWNTATVYSPGPPASVVTTGGETYVCVIGHTSGGSFDPSKWIRVSQKGDQGVIGLTGNTGPTGPAAWSQPAAWATAQNYSATAPASVVTYNGECYVCTTSHTSGGAFDASKFIKVSAQGNTGSTGDPGGAITIRYTYDSATGDADPTAGKIRLNNVALASATQAFLNLSDNLGTSWASVIDQMDASTNAIKGQVRIVKAGDATKWMTANVTARTSATGYRKLTLSSVVASATNPFTNGDSLLLLFNRVGDQGATGGTGPTGPAAWATPPVAYASGISAQSAAPATVVINSGETYVCNTAHTTTGTFDAAKWTKISGSVGSVAGKTGAVSLVMSDITDMRGIGGRLDVVNSSTIKFAPFNGDKVVINGAVKTIPTAGLSITTASTALNSFYYVYVADANSDGVLDTIEVSATAPSADNYGVQVKTGDTTRLFVGLVCTAIASNVFGWTNQFRATNSWYNPRLVMLETDLTADTNIGASPWTTLANHTQILWAHIQGRAFDLSCRSTFSNAGTSGSAMYFGASVDGSATIVSAFTSPGANYFMSGGQSLPIDPLTGKHTVNLVGGIGASPASTGTYLGSGYTSACLTGWM